MPNTVAAAADLFGDGLNPSELSERKDRLAKAMTESTIMGLAGEVAFGDNHDSGAPTVVRQSDARSAAKRQLEKLNVSKSVDPSVMAALEAQLASPASGTLSKEWTLANPLSTGLVPFDLEAPAKLLTPRPTPLRNSMPRQRGQGSSRRFKVISGFTGTGTGGIGTLQPGINESTTNTGPGGLAYIRPPYITYAGYDVNLSYVSWGLSDSVSWQAEYQGQGFEDIRSLSNTALLYSTMLLDERLILWGRGTTGNGYVGALGTPTISLSAVAASVAGVSATTLTSTTYWVIAAADAGDLMGTNGSFHQGPTTAAASVAISGSSQAIQVSVSADVTGALGYNMFVASVSGGPFCYAGRTGYNVGYVTAPPSLTNGTAAASAADNSAVATNFDGLLTNLAASGGYVKRLNSTFSTSTPGVEFQSAFSAVFDAVKADPDEIWMNGHDRNQLTNAMLAGNNVNNYGLRFFNDATTGATLGTLVQGIVNQITGKQLPFNTHPWMAQGNTMIRSRTLPIPDSNVAETSAFAMVQDYAAIQWPVVQYTYDSSTLEIGTLCHYAPQWSALIQGIQLNG